MKYLKILSTLFLALSFSCTTIVQSNNNTDFAEIGGNTIEKNVNNLKLSLRVDKSKFSQNEALKVEVLLSNVGLSPVYVYPNLQWGHSASLTLVVTDSAGHAVEPVFVDDSLTKPPLGRGPRVMLLYPNHFLGTESVRRLDEFNISKSGKLKLQVEYHSPFASGAVDEKPFWGKEHDTLQSNVVEIEVTVGAK